jgi:hypothetical protein
MMLQISALVMIGSDVYHFLPHSILHNLSVAIFSFNLMDEIYYVLLLDKHHDFFYATMIYLDGHHPQHE